MNINKKIILPLFSGGIVVFLKLIQSLNAGFKILNLIQLITVLIAMVLIVVYRDKVILNHHKFSRMMITLVLFVIILPIIYFGFYVNIGYTNFNIDPNIVANENKEIWIESILVDGKKIELNQFENNNWIYQYDRLYTVTDIPLKIKIQGKSNVIICFLKHPYSGTVEVAYNDNKEVYNLYSNNMQTLQVEYKISDNVWVFIGTTILLFYMCLIASKLLSSIKIIQVYIDKIYIRFFIKLKKESTILKNLAINDLKSRYVGSYLGIFWSFINPLITVLIYWFVFEKGFKSGERPDGTPFLVWLICGLGPWFYYNEVIMLSMGSFFEYSYLIKKMRFNYNLIPLIKVTSSTVVHIAFVGIILLVSIIKGVSISIVLVQIVYYLFCMIFLVVSVSNLVAIMTPFLKDIKEIIAVILQIQFWITPIVWSSDILSDNFIIIFKLNPMYYIVEGYRDSIFRDIYFTSKPIETLYFWCICISVMMLSRKLFNKMRPHLVDVI